MLDKQLLVELLIFLKCHLSHIKKKIENINLKLSDAFEKVLLKQVLFNPRDEKLCVQKQDDKRARCSECPDYVYFHLKYHKEMCYNKRPKI